ncbi:MAG: RMD1 family protein [Verrucomicrobiota bacterium]|nr:RMD1 family protein [Verrucomicrobiota bacterium]
MRCTGYCTAAGYDIPALFQFLQATDNTQLFRDVIHTAFKEDRAAKRDIFYFPYGVTLFWGFSEEEELQFLERIRNFEQGKLAKREVDEFSFGYGDKIKIEEDDITLPKKDPLTKLAVSYAIAQSIKLTVFEETIARTIEETKHLPHKLAQKGKISLSRRETSKKMGEIFLERNHVNLHTEILDTPEFFWEHAELEPLYRRVIHYLDVLKRVELLNRKLKLLHELYEILSTELNHQQSSRLEITIIVLILIEVVLALLRDLFHLI